MLHPAPALLQSLPCALRQMQKPWPWTWLPLPPGSAEVSLGPLTEVKTHECNIHHGAGVG
jgi:hypothetical protein